MGRTVALIGAAVLFWSLDAYIKILVRDTATIYESKTKMDYCLQDQGEITAANCGLADLA